MKRNVLPIPHLCLYLQKDFQQDVGHSSDLDQKRSGSPLTKKDQEENGIESLNYDDQIRRKRTLSVPTTSPLSRGTLKSKGGGKLSFHFCADGNTIETVFRTIISVSQLSIHGAVSDVCEEYSTCQTRTRRPVLAGKSDPLFAPANLLITTPRLSIEIPAQENLLQKYKERVERLPQQGRLIKICIDAGFLKTVQVGQCFMTKHTDEFLQFTEPVTCREYTLPRNEKSTDPKGWIRGNTNIGPVLEVTTSHLQGKYGVEIRIESVNNDNSHSWVRISHGLNKLVTDLIDKEYDDNGQETSETKTEVFAFASRSNAKVKPRRPSTTCSSARTVHIRVRMWIDIETGAQSDQAYPVAMRLNTLLRHLELFREEDGAIEFWRLKNDLRNKFEYSQYWSDDMWKSKMAGGGGNKKRFQYCTDPSGQEILYLRALQGHSGRNPIDPSLQDKILIPNNFLEYVYHIGCAVNLHSITNSGLIAGGQNSSRDRQTVFLTVVNPMQKNHQDPKRARFDHTTSCILQAKVESAPRYGVLVDIYSLPKRKDLSSVKHDRTQSSSTILSQLIVSRKQLWWNLKKSNTRKCVCVSPRPPPTISYKDHWMNELDSEIAGSSRDTQRIQPEPKTQLSRTVRLVTRWREETLGRTKFDRDTLNQEKHDEVTDPTSTGKPASGHESTKRCVLTPRHVENDQTGTGKPSRWIKKRNTKLISEYQDCHFQL